MAPRETENNAYAKFWGDKQRTLWYFIVFLEWSIAGWRNVDEPYIVKCIVSSFSNIISAKLFGLSSSNFHR